MSGRNADLRSLAGVCTALYGLQPAPANAPIARGWKIEIKISKQTKNKIILLSLPLSDKRFRFH